MSSNQYGSTPTATNYRQGLKTQARVGSVLTTISLVSPRIRSRAINKPSRIGIFCQWGVGDAVLLLPLLRGLRTAFPDASLELIGKAWLGVLFANEDCCDRTHTLVPPWTAYSKKYRPTFGQIKSYLSQISGLRKESFDWLISARFDPREILQTRLLRDTIYVWVSCRWRAPLDYRRSWDEPDHARFDASGGRGGGDMPSDNRNCG